MVRILTFNCHEAWLYQLSGLEAKIDIVVGLEGRYTQNWDTQIRPVPVNARLIQESDISNRNIHYDCVIAHNISDLLAVKGLSTPKILILHGTLEGRIANEKSGMDAEQFRETLKAYVLAQGIHVVAISALKAQSWDLPATIIHNGVDVDEYHKYEGDVRSGLRVSNQILQRQNILRWEFHLQAFSGLPVKIVGHNPDLPDVKASANWRELKNMLSRYRFYIHTAEPLLEDGFNLAMMEAMAAGMPVLGNCHPTSIIEHGVNGFLSDNAEELHTFGEELLNDRALATCLGQAARETIRRDFPASQFVRQFSTLLNTICR